MAQKTAVRHYPHTAYAIRLHQEQGKSVYEAAAIAQCSPSTLYKALYPKGKKRVKK